MLMINDHHMVGITNYCPHQSLGLQHDPNAFPHGVLFWRNSRHWFQKEIPVSSLLGDDLSCFKQAGSLARYTGHPTSLKTLGSWAASKVSQHDSRCSMIVGILLGPRPKRRFQGSSWGPRSVDTCVWQKTIQQQCTGVHHISESIASCWPPGKDRNMLISSVCFFNSQVSKIKHSPTLNQTCSLVDCAFPHIIPWLRLTRLKSRSSHWKGELSE